MHGSNGLRCRSLLQEGIDRPLMQTGFKKVLELRKDLINIGCKLNFQPSPLLDGFLIEAPHGLKIHKINVIKGIKPVGTLHHKCFSNDVFKWIDRGMVDSPDSIQETLKKYLKRISA